MSRRYTDYEVIDFGAHLYPDPVAPDSADDPDQGVYDHIGPVFTDPEVALERFIDGGVDAAVLSQPYYIGYKDGDEVATANDALLEVIEDYEQYYGLAAIPVPEGGDAAAEEFERCLENGYHGGAIETLSEGIEVSDPSLEPVFDIAERHGAPIMVHPKLDASLQASVDSSERPILDDRYRLNAIFGREAALSESIAKVIHEGVLDRHPDLNLVFHHLGGNIASMLGRVHLHLDPGRWPEQEHAVSYEEFKRQLEERIYIDTSGFFGYELPIRVALEVLPSTQLLFATDTPAEPRSAEEFDIHVSAITNSCSSGDARRILSSNTRELLANVD